MGLHIGQGLLPMPTGGGAAGVFEGGEVVEAGLSSFIAVAFGAVGFDEGGHALDEGFFGVGGWWAGAGLG